MNLNDYPGIPCETDLIEDGGVLIVDPSVAATFAIEPGTYQIEPGGEMILRPQTLSPGDGIFRVHGDPDLQAALQDAESAGLDSDPATAPAPSRVIDAEIATLYNPHREEMIKIRGYMDLTIADVSDKAGAEAVKQAKKHVSEFLAKVKASHDEAKAGVLEWARRIDGGAKEIRDGVGVIRDHLLAEQERIEAIKEADREAKRKERAALLQARVDQAQALGAVISLAMLEAMSEKAFAVYLKEQREAKERRDFQEAETARLRKLQEEAEARERAQGIREEEERQAAQAKEQKKAKAMLDAKEAENRAEADRLARERADLDRRQAEDKAREEGKEKARVEAEAAAERERLRLEREEERKAAIERARPDVEKLQLYVASLREVAPPVLASQAGVAAGSAVQKLFLSFLGDSNALIQRMIVQP